MMQTQSFDLRWGLVLYLFARELSRLRNLKSDVVHCKGSTAITLQEENFNWNLNFAISLMENSLNFNSTHYYIFGNLSMIAYIIAIQISKFANI